MKNLIITVGILMLLMMGMAYDMDVRNLSSWRRTLDWACEEAAYLAAAVMDVQGQDAALAEQEAAALFCRNMGLPEDGNPGEAHRILKEQVRWKLEVTGEVLVFEADCGFAGLHLFFLQDTVLLKGRAEIPRKQYFSSNSTG